MGIVNSVPKYLGMYVGMIVVVGVPMNWAGLMLPIYCYPAYLPTRHSRKPSAHYESDFPWSIQLATALEENLCLSISELGAGPGNVST